MPTKPDRYFRVQERAVRFQVTGWSKHSVRERRVATVEWVSPMGAMPQVRELVDDLAVAVSVAITTRDWTGEIIYDAADGVRLSPDPDAPRLSPGLESGIRAMVAQVIVPWYAPYFAALCAAKDNTEREKIVFPVSTP